METVHRLSCELSAACLQNKGYHLTLAVYDSLHLIVFQNEGIAVLSQGNAVCCLGLGFCRNQGNHTISRNFCKTIYLVTDLFGRNSLAFSGLCTCRKAFRQLNQCVICKSQGVADSHTISGFYQTCNCLCSQLMAFFQNCMECFFRVLINSCDGRAGQDVVELMQQDFFPQTLNCLCRICLSLLGCQRAPQFQITHGKLTSSVVVLHHCLRSIGSAVSAEIQLSGIGMLRSAFCFHILEELDGAFQFYLRAAFQVSLTLRIFQIVSCRAATAIAVTKGQEECIQISLLASVLPHVHQLGGVGAVGVAGRQEGTDLRAVHAFPVEIMVRELFAFIVRPENLLSYQIFNAAALQNLRQCSGITKGIRQPQHLAVYAELFLIIAFAVEQLTDQCFPGSHIRIRFYPHRALCDPLAILNRLFDSFKQLGVVFAAHLITGRLALDIFVFRIFFQQAQLCCKGTLCLSVCLCHRPQPCQIDMGIADCVEYRHSGTVLRFQCRAKCFSACLVGCDSASLILLKINHKGKGLQRLCDLCSPQGIRIELVQQLS